MGLTLARRRTVYSTTRVRDNFLTLSGSSVSTTPSYPPKA